MYSCTHTAVPLLNLVRILNLVLSSSCKPISRKTPSGEPGRAGPYLERLGFYIKIIEINIYLQTLHVGANDRSAQELRNAI